MTIAIRPSLVALVLAACGDDAGSGTARFVTWGEELIEQGIPAAGAGVEVGLVDGWRVRFDKVLVTFREIVVADGAGTVGARSAGSFLVDHVRPGRKELVSFSGLRAKRWDEVGFQIAPADAATTLVAADAADRDLMVAGGYSVYAAGTAERAATANEPELRKTFRWGFPIATRYFDCQQAPEGGAPTDGIVVSDGGVDESELTIHGDHFFYDRLQASDDPAQPTSLRFAAIAAADANADGEVTLAELGAVTIDPTVYNPAPFDATTMGQFVTALARTVGHFRGEGECTVSVVGAAR